MTKITGTTGADTLTGGVDSDIVEGLGGDDIVTGGLGDTLLAGGAGADLGRLDFSGAGGSLRFAVAANLTGVQTLAGVQVSGFERVELVGGSAGDWLTGGSLSDLLDGRGGNDWLKGGDGDDRLLGGGGHDILDGGAGADTLDGGAGSDQLIGGAGDDLLVAATGDVSVDGGSGRDHGLLDFMSAGAPISFSIAANLAEAVKVGATPIRGLESIDFSAGPGADNLTGGAFSDTLRGGSGADVLAGEGGDDSLSGGADADTLTGGAGADTIDGGAGLDTARFSGQLSDYRATLLGDGEVAVTDLRAGGDGADVIRGVERFTFADRTVSFSELVTGEPNHAPVAMDDTATTAEDAGLSLSLLANDSDPDLGDTLKVVSIDTAGVQGSVSLGSDGTIFYTATAAVQALNAGETLTEHFTYTAADMQGATATAGVTLTVVGANDDPTALDNFANLGEDGATIDVLANDFDIDAGDQVALTRVTSGVRGAARITAEGTVVYTPGAVAQSLAEGQTLADSFTYTVSDTAGATSEARVSVVIHGENDAPIATADSFTIAKSGVTMLGDLLGNDIDVDQGDHISLSAMQTISAKGATVTVDAQGQFAYDPGAIFADLAAGATTSDSFTYEIVDSHGAASTATVALTVTGSPVAEPALAASAFVEEDASSDNLYQSVLDLAEFVLGESVTLVSIDTGGTLGSVSLGDDSLVYTADHPSLDALWGDHGGDTQFLYTVRTAGGELHTGAVQVTLTGVNDAPEARPDALSIGEGGSSGNLWTSLLSNDLDLDAGQRLDVWSVDTTGTAGRVTFDLNARSLVYNADTPAISSLDAGETLIDSFTYTVRDELGAFSTTTVTVTVAGADGAATGWAVF
ncbi:MAG: Ig-like domain-containing protein [Phenylobacterium sp.]|uniref:Ig-like domain-containing protein n=1 Tax=Phenylobacterium sp. TaxID=1871053 RepID=UPI0027337FDB|nr:Ig-like domain-containing protein [Phenylobacterium sp.]MDP3748009.1 Ig-like domain-containing protein [Phenylobacterium sp.]